MYTAIASPPNVDLSPFFKPCQHLKGSLWFVAAAYEQRGAIYTHLWLLLATLAACAYLWPCALTMPFNYITVSWDLKYVQHLECT